MSVWYIGNHIALEMNTDYWNIGIDTNFKLRFININILCFTIKIY